MGKALRSCVTSEVTKWPAGSSELDFQLSVSCFDGITVEGRGRGGGAVFKEQT